MQIKLVEDNVLLVGKKLFKRHVITKKDSQIIDWRRAKTNHQVKREEFDKLEEIFSQLLPVPNIAKETSSFLDITKDVDRISVERGIANILFKGTMLDAVKFVKLSTGLGLRDSKNFVDNFVTRRLVYNKHS